MEFGAHFVTPGYGDWDNYQRQIFRTGQFPIAKVQIPVGFQTNPSHVEDLISDGARTIILRGEDCDLTYQRTRQDLVHRGFLDVIDRYPNVRFVLELGNEPELCQSPMGAWTYRYQALDTVKRLRPEIDRPNLEWIISVPVKWENYQILLNGGQVQQHFDGLGVHLYGHHRLEDGGSWDSIRTFEHATGTGLDVWVTELGINDPGLSKAEKARRYKSFVSQNHHSSVQGYVIFAIGQGTIWPQYEIDHSMARELANCRFFPLTDLYLCGDFRDYWENNGGLMVFGYPLTEQMSEDRMRVQYFERAVFEYHPDNPDPFKVLLRHLAREHFNLRYGRYP